MTPRGLIRTVIVMIEAQHLTKRYGDKFAVNDISFSVEPGVVTGFLGPNGAGKSTTMRMILGLDRPTSGDVVVNGRRYRDMTAPLREIGTLLDARAVEPGRTAANHLLWLAHSNGISARRVQEVLVTVGLADVADSRAGTFSLGMNQRLGIAAALLGDPPVLMFDEPINGLDPDGIIWIRNIMKSLAAEGRTVFLSSHLMSEMAQTADHLIVIARGRIIATGSVDEIVSANATPSVTVRSSDPDTLNERLVHAGAVTVRGLDGELSVSGLSSAVIGSIAHRADIPLTELSTHGASLEDAFLELTHESTDYRATVGASTGA
ncbi:MAG: multidrug transporter ATP-binding protein [Acidimicrobiales bacterium]|nr:multidrug transporter ATP-binding protein [Acidimicrobiales bacterium]